MSSMRSPFVRKPSLSSRVTGRSSMRSFLAVATASIFCASPQAFGERADKEKPAVINSDHSNSDDLNQIRVFTGDVVLTKGTIILRADQLTVKEDPEGYNLGVAIATQPGKLAYFKQKREGVDEFIEGQAERIEYDEKADMVRLFNHAIVKRLVAGRDADESRGDRIDYNTRTEVYDVQSNDPTSRRARTTTILQPKIKPGASGTAPVNQQPSPPIELKKQTVLETAPGS
jgi:lipopolysaccharide export system protein LptA